MIFEEPDFAGALLYLEIPGFFRDPRLKRLKRLKRLMLFSIAPNQAGCKSWAISKPPPRGRRCQHRRGARSRINRPNPTTTDNVICPSSLFDSRLFPQSVNVSFPDHLCRLAATPCRRNEIKNPRAHTFLHVGQVFQRFPTGPYLSNQITRVTCSNPSLYPVPN